MWPKRLPDLIRDVRKAKVSPFPKWEWVAGITTGALSSPSGGPFSQSASARSTTRVLYDPVAARSIVQGLLYAMRFPLRYRSLP